MEERDFRDQLSMIDRTGVRTKIVPAEVRGPWRTRRTIVHSALMLFFLVLPWIKFGGEQAVLIDLPRRHFVLFGVQFWSHDAPLIFLLLAFFALALALATLLYGRIWCGWACPQTVFIDGVIRRIEFWTEGSHLARRQLDQAPWGLNKIFRKSIKWVLFISFSALLTHSFLAYFVGTDRLAGMMQQSPSENWADFLFILFTTGIVLFDLTWFREQFCLIVCPYGRIQSALLDRNTVTVQYDALRGEPRRGRVPEGKSAGACVNCTRCVQVCPTGIDIRNGIQMECIGCTACIDACDEIMEKINQPKGLIRYKASVEQPRRFRLRAGIYIFGLIAIFIFLTITLAHRGGVDVSVLRATDVPFYEKGDKIVNSYRLHVHNESAQDIEVTAVWENEADAQFGKIELPAMSLLIHPDEFRMIPFVVEMSKDWMQKQNRKNLRLKINSKIYEVPFVGPIVQ